MIAERVELKPIRENIDMNPFIRNIRIEPSKYFAYINDNSQINPSNKSDLKDIKFCHNNGSIFELKVKGIVFYLAENKNIYALKESNDLMPVYSGDNILKWYRYRIADKGTYSIDKDVDLKFINLEYQSNYMNLNNINTFSSIKFLSINGIICNYYTGGKYCIAADNNLLYYKNEDNLVQYTFATFYNTYIKSWKWTDI